MRQWYLAPSMVAAAAFAAVTSILFFRARKHYRALPLLRAIPPGESIPDCMVVIPARNEEGVVGGAVQSFPPDTVIVVDDQSTDRTADESREAGAGVLEAPSLVEGELGKANACMAGARILTSRWILFADADTRYQPGFLDSAVRYAEAGGLALLSVHLTPRPQTFVEHLTEPYAAALFFSSASTGRDPAAMFRGQCILARRQAYEFIGGHAAVGRFLAEDMKLALLAKRHRMSFAVARAANLGHVRNYAGWEGLWRGIERHVFRLVQVNPWTGLTILLTALAAALWLPLAVWLELTGHRVVPWVLVILVLLELRPWYGWRALLGLVAIYIAIPVLLHGLISALADRQIEWKGRTVKAS